MGWSDVILMFLSFCATSVGVAMSKKFLSTIFIISRSSMFSGVAATMPKTVAPALANRAPLSEVFEHLAACCTRLTHGRHLCLSVPSYTSMFSR